MPRKEYAIYKGDEFIMIGTKEECAKRLNIKPDHVQFMASPTNAKRDKGNRMTAIVIEDEKEKQNAEI